MTFPDLPLDKVTVSVCSPLPVFGVVILTVNNLPESCETAAFTPASELLILGWPKKPVPEMVIVTVLPATAEPFTFETWKAGATGAAAVKTAAVAAEPPSTFVTIKVTGVAEAAPRVQDTVSDVVAVGVAVPQVPSLEAATTTPVSKFVPVMVKAVVPLGVAVAGVTPVTVGPGSMINELRVADTLAVPPSVLVTE